MLGLAAPELLRGGLIAALLVAAPAVASIAKTDCGMYFGSALVFGLATFGYDRWRQRRRKVR